MFIQPYRVSITSYVVSCRKLYWNYFHSPFLLGFRSGFAISNPICTNYYFSKAINFLTRCFKNFSSHGLLFGFPDDYLNAKAEADKRFSDTDAFYRLFIRAHNVIYRGYYWRGGALSNFRKFRSQSSYYAKLPLKDASYMYYPNAVFATHYSYATLSIGFESLASRVPLVTPVDASCDPQVFAYPIPINSSTQNIYFFSQFFFSLFFYSFVVRLSRFQNIFDSKSSRSKLNTGTAAANPSFNLLDKSKRKFKTLFRRNKLNLKKSFLSKKFRSSHSKSFKYFTKSVVSSFIQIYTSTSGKVSKFSSAPANSILTKRSSRSVFNKKIRHSN